MHLVTPLFFVTMINFHGHASVELLKVFSKFSKLKSAKPKFCLAFGRYYAIICTGSSPIIDINYNTFTMNSYHTRRINKYK